MKTGPKPIPVVLRFWKKVAVAGPSDCWNWTGATTWGYGVLGGADRRSSPVRAHRLSWEIHFGPIPSGLQVCHRCDNRRCVNPAHLFLGTLADNMADMVAKGRQARGERCRAHRQSVGEDRPNAKLTEPDVRAIRAALDGGAVGRSLAKQYGVSPMVISNIRRGKTWRHVENPA